MRHRPFPLLLAAVLVLLQGVLLVVVAVMALANLGGAAGLGIASALFFLVCAAGLALCARGLARCQSWTRAPIVLAEVIDLGLAWNARHTDPALAVALAAVGVVVLAGIAHPATTRALTPPEE